MTADQSGYNGWTNYETWVTALWIDNEQGTYSEACAMADEMLADGLDKYQAADAYEGWAEATYLDPIAEAGPTGLHTDLLTAAWGRINWPEIAEHYLDSAREAAEYEAER